MISICMIIRIVIEGDPEPSPGIYSLEGSRISCLTEEGSGSQQVSPLPSPASELLSFQKSSSHITTQLKSLKTSADSGFNILFRNLTNIFDWPAEDH